MLRFLIVFIAVTKISFSTSAQNYRLVQDLNTAPYSSNVGKISNMVTIDSTTYFFADTYRYGREIWKTKGDPTTTLMLKDLNEGPVPSVLMWQNAQLNALNDTIFAHSAVGRKIYKIAKNGVSINTNEEFLYGESAVYNNALYYNGHGGLKKYTNGKAFTVKSALVPYSFCQCGGTLYISAYSSPYGQELWKTDGTESGTVLVKDILPGTGHGEPYKLTCGPNNKLYFWAYSIAGSSKVYLFSSDGTTDGTKSLQYLADYSHMDELERMVSMKTYKDSLFFGFSNNLMFRTDGTPAGTKLITSNPSVKVDGTLGVISNKLIVAGYKDYVSGIMTYDNGVFTVLKPYDYIGKPYKLGAVVNNKLVFPINTTDAGDELWVTDGTPSGTYLLKDINPGPKGSSIEYMYATNGVVYFGADNGTAGYELWKTDGTANGTRLVKDIGEGTQSAGIYNHENPELGGGGGGTATVFKNDFYFRTFSANDARILFKGTIKPLSIKQVENQTMGNGGPIADSLFFYTLGHVDRYGQSYIDSLMKSNGTTTIKVSHPWGDYTISEALAFSPNEVDYTGYSGIYRFNTTSNTFNRLAAVSRPRFLTSYKNAYYYSVYNSSSEEYDLYKTNLTDFTTERVTYLGLRPEYVTVYKDTLFFTGSPLAPYYPDFDHRAMFLKMAGNSVLQKASPDLVTGGPFVEYKGKLFMPGYIRTYCESCYSDYGLYTYDDKQGVRPLYTFTSSNTLPYVHVSNLRVVNNILFFTVGTSSYGSELWQTDGTLGGTHVVKDIYPGSNSSNPGLFIPWNNKLYFVADDGVNGRELWTTDGTTNGTVRLTSITSGKEDPQFSYPVARKGRIFFFANDMIHGSELWMYDINLCESLKTGNWNDATVWSCGAVPSVNNDVRIISPHKIELNPTMGKQSILSIDVQPGSVFNATGILSSKP
jgi:ELWxxDGT repeat protein